jgi:membrane protease YdiL (CAAX protease family)
MTWLTQLVWNPDEHRLRALWRLLLHGAALFLIAMMLAILGQSIGLASIGGLGLVPTSATALTVALATWLCAHVLDHRPFAAFGLHPSPRWWADLAAGFVIGVLLMSGIFVVELSAGWLTIVGYRVGASTGQLFWLALIDPWLTFVGVAFYEELLCRGYHLRNLAEGLYFARLGPRLAPRAALVLATVFSAAIFGFAHAGNDNATWISTFNVGLAGCMLALGLLWTGELALPIGLHLSWNFFQGNVYGFPVSGNAMGPRVFDVVQGGDPLITGGAFGPEAGLIGVVAMVFGAALIALWVRLSRKQLRLQLGLTQPASEANAS